MIKKLLSFVVVALLTAFVAGSVLAEEIEGKISKIENSGRTVTVKAKDGKEVTLRISSGATTIEGISDRSEFAEGQNVKVTYDASDRNTASMVNVQK